MGRDGPGEMIRLLALIILILMFTYLRSRQGGIRDNVSHNVGDGVHLVHDLVHVDTAAVCHLSVVAVPAIIDD